METVHFYPGEESQGQVVDKFPYDGSYSTDYDEVHRIAMLAVDRCKAIVAAEVKDFKGIEVYKEMIGYEVLKPNCCANCRWCVESKPGTAPKYSLECHCPYN